MTTAEAEAYGWKGRSKVFATWHTQIDNIIARRFGGMTTADFPDCDFGGMFESGATPAEAAREVIRGSME